jgi:5-hydroxyisourate hydrolase-like protein (transthyretin family)
MNLRCVSACARAAAFLLSVAIAAAGAQERPLGTIQGTVTDSTHSRPAAGAMILLTRLSPEPADFRSAVTDDKGRFRFDTLLAGRYAVAFATTYLDSLELTLPSREVVVAEGAKAEVNFGVPSGATLRAAACPGLQLPKGEGAVVGQVTDADTDQPLRGAEVAVNWTDLSVDKTTLQPISAPRGGAVPVDSLGRYRLCGVPTDTYLLVQVQHHGRAGSTLSLIVDDDGGVLLRNLSLSKESSRSLAALDSAASAPADTTPLARLTGTATLTGTVRSPAGQPLADAQVRIVDAVGMVRTDSSGHFTLANQPAGTQLLEARRVGYLLSRTPVELRSGKSVETVVILSRIVNLDSIRIVARRSRYPEFERRSGRSGFGRHLNEQQIEQRHAMETSDLIRTMPGFRIEGAGLDARVVSTRGAISFSQGSCATNVVIDGFQHQDINLISPADVGAVEAYPGPAGAPMQYDSACGVIVIWTKR